MTSRIKTKFPTTSKSNTSKEILSIEYSAPQKDETTVKKIRSSLRASGKKHIIISGKAHSRTTAEILALPGERE